MEKIGNGNYKDIPLIGYVLEKNTQLKILLDQFDKDLLFDFYLMIKDLIDTKSNKEFKQGFSNQINNLLMLKLKEYNKKFNDSNPFENFSPNSYGLISFNLKFPADFFYRNLLIINPIIEKLNPKERKQFVERLFLIVIKTNQKLSDSVYWGGREIVDSIGGILKKSEYVNFLKKLGLDKRVDSNFREVIGRKYLIENELSKKVGEEILNDLVFDSSISDTERSFIVDWFSSSGYKEEAVRGWLEIAFNHPNDDQIANVAMFEDAIIEDNLLSTILKMYSKGEITLKNMEELIDLLSGRLSITKFEKLVNSDKLPKEIKEYAISLLKSDDYDI